MFEQWLHTQVGIRGNPARLSTLLLEDGTSLLRSGLGVDPSAGDAFVIEVEGGDELSTAFTRLRVQIAPVEQRASCVRMPLRWEPDSEGSFSTFRGVLEWEARDEHSGQLTLFGRYGLPDGDTSAAAIMAGTRTTARRLLRALASELTGAAAAGVDLGAPVPPASLHVRDVMTSTPVTVHQHTPMLTATLVLVRHQIAGMPVLDDDGRAVGVLTETDLLARAAAPRQRTGPVARTETAKRLATTAGDACSRPPVTIGADASLQEAARLLLDRDISRVLVVDDERLTGLLSRHDVLEALTRSPAQLQEYVDACLDDEGITGVHAEVLASGAVRLFGRVRYRSSVPMLEHAVRRIDGVINVDNDLAWSEDDTVITT